MRDILFQTQPNDGPAFAIGLLVTGVVTVVACAVPTLRAVRVDPTIPLE